MRCVTEALDLQSVLSVVRFALPKEKLVIVLVRVLPLTVPILRPTEVQCLSLKIFNISFYYYHLWLNNLYNAQAFNHQPKFETILQCRCCQGRFWGLI